MTARAAVPIGVLCAVLLISSGLSVTPDSMRYLDVASQIAAGEGATSYHLNLSSKSVPSRLGLWAPGYPTCLSLLFSLGLDRAAAALVMNLASLALLLVAVTGLARLLRLPPAGALLSVAMLLCHPYLRLAWGYVWSEPIFLALVYLSLLTLLRGLGDRPRHAVLLLAGALTGAAFAVRYAGLFLAAYAAAVLLVFGFKRWGPRRALPALLAWLLPFLGIAWLAVAPNLKAFGSLFGPPRPAPDAPIHFLLRRLHQMLLAAEGAAAGLPVLLLAAFVALALVGIRTRRAEPAVPSADSTAPGWRAACVGGFAIFYAGALLLSLSRVVTSPIDHRYLLPVVPALVLVAAFLARRPLERLPAGRRQLLAVAAASVIVLGSWVDAVGVRRNADLFPRPREDAIAAWAETRTTPDALFVGHGLWWLRFREGCVVLEGGDHANPKLTAAAVAEWLEGVGGRFRTVHLLFQAGPEMALDAVDDFVAALPKDHWDVSAPQTVLSRDTIAVTAMRR